MKSENACARNASRLWGWGTAVQLLGLALMVGGMLALGAFTAPIVFGQLPRETAAPIMAMIFRRYDIVLLVALGLVALGEALRFAVRRFSLKCPLIVIRWVLLIGLGGSLLYSTLVVNADIERFNKAGVHRSPLTQAGHQFESRHKLSESLYKLDLLMAVLLLLMSPFLTQTASRPASSCAQGDHSAACESGESAC